MHFFLRLPDTIHTNKHNFTLRSFNHNFALRSFHTSKITCSFCAECCSPPRRPTAQCCGNRFAQDGIQKTSAKWMLPCVLFAGNASNTHSECRLKIRYRSGKLSPFLVIKSLTRGKIYHLKDGLFHFIFLGGSRESEILRKDTIAGNVGLGNSGTSMDVRAYSVSCLILRDGLAYYCASISREERPIFVVKLNENDNKDRTKEPKGALRSAKLAQCQHILSIRVKEKCNNKLYF